MATAIPSASAEEGQDTRHQHECGTTHCSECATGTRRAFCHGSELLRTRRSGDNSKISSFVHTRAASDATSHVAVVSRWVQHRDVKPFSTCAGTHAAISALLRLLMHIHAHMYTAKSGPTKTKCTTTLSQAVLATHAKSAWPVRAMPTWRLYFCCFMCPGGALRCLF